MSTIRRNAAAAPPLEYLLLPWSLGWVAVAATERGVRLVHVGDDPETVRNGLTSRLRGATLVEAGRKVSKWGAQVVAQLESPGRNCDLPLDLQGTDFQRRVWKALCRIPPGKTASYAEIARQVGSPKAVRAVGLACGSNPLAPMIPCHRVLRSDGSLGGYGFGLDRKRALLEREQN